MRHEAERYLDWLLNDLGEHMSRYGIDQGRTTAMMRVSVALDALRAVGEVTDDESTAVVARAEQLIEVHRVELLATRFSASVQTPRLFAPRFVRLVPAPDDERLVYEDVAFRVIGIEVYDSRLAVLWRTVRLGPITTDFDERLDPDSIAVSDDAGTPYRSVGGSSTGRMNEMTGRYPYQPAPPDDATSLTVIAFGSTFEVPLADGLAS